MAIWKQSVDLDRINGWNAGSMVEHLGMRVTEVGDDWVRGTMPVDARTCQPFGLLLGANLVLEVDKEMAVGLDINANHVRAVTGGLVTGTARPIHLGRSTQVWEIRIEDEKQQLTCISRLTMAVVPRRSPKAV